MLDTNERTATPPAGFKPTPELSAAGKRIWEGQAAYIASGSHGVTPTWSEEDGIRFFIDAALRPLTGEQLDELICCLTNVRQTTAHAEPERIGPILGRVVENLRLRSGTPAGQVPIATPPHPWLTEEATLRIRRELALRQAGAPVGSR